MSEIAWEKQWDQAFARAESENKGVYLDFFNPS